MNGIARAVAIAFGVVTLVIAHPLAAQQGLGPEITVSDLDNEQVHPAIAYNETRDQYLVVWQNNWGGVSDIYAQRLDGEGNLLSWFTVDTGTNSRIQPSVTYDSTNDRYLVVWAYDFAGDGSDWDIWGRIIPWSGPSMSFTSFLVAGEATAIEWKPRVAFALAQQEFLVAWEEVDSSSGAFEINAQRLTLVGTYPTGGGFVPVASGTPDRKNPDVAYNLSRNEYVVVYDVGDADIKATRLAGDGTVIGGGEFTAAGWPDDETAPAIVSCSNHDQYFVVWQSQTASDAMEVYGRYLAGDGTTGVVVHFASTSFDEAAPDVACLEQLQEYVVAWEQQYYHSAGPFGIEAQRVTWGNSLGPEYSLRTVGLSDSGMCFQPALASAPGAYLAGWSHHRQGSSWVDVHGRLATLLIFGDGFESGNMGAWSGHSP